MAPEPAHADATSSPPGEDGRAMKILLVDNYDSYTYNLFQQLARVGGAEPLVVRNDELRADELDALELDAIVISPGPGHPDRSRDFGISKHALDLSTPLLGVCLGHQGLAARYGGRVEPATEPVHGRHSPIHHAGTGLFDGIPQGFAAVRYHSLVVSPPLPPCLEAIAFTPDGLIMGVRHRDRPQWGVQFHPESIGTAHGDRIIANFLALARLAPRSGMAKAPPAPTDPSVVPRRSYAAPRVASPERAPLYQRLPRWVPPEDVFVHAYGDDPHAYWLDSALEGDPCSRYSFMGAPTSAGDRVIRYHAPQRQLVIDRDGQRSVHEQSLFSWLEQQLPPRPPAAPSLPFPFRGGYVGYFGYSLKGECGGSFQASTSWPDAMLLECGHHLVFDHQARAIYAVARREENGEEEEAHAWFRALASTLEGLPSAPPPKHEQLDDPVLFRLARSHEQYLRDIDTCLREIRRGETYEVCLTNQLLGPPLAHPLDAYRFLRARNPAPYGAFLRLGDHAVLSCSPELFLRIDPAGGVVTKPIKGTRRRGATAREDDELREQLANSEKDRAENLMIVDLLRNDLGRVCEIGSIEAPALMRVESFTSVHQLVSTVSGRLRPEHSAVTCLQAAFPGGSMTGAPKLRTMEIIDALESDPRGVYSGCIGYLSTDGAAELGITIRTAVTTPHETTIGVGGAIVSLSEPQAELDEMLLKGEALLRGIATAKTGRPDAWKISSGPP